MVVKTYSGTCLNVMCFTAKINLFPDKTCENEVIEILWIEKEIAKDIQPRLFFHGHSPSQHLLLAVTFDRPNFVM